MKQRVISFAPYIVGILLIVGALIWQWPTVSATLNWESIKEFFKASTKVASVRPEPKHEVYNKPGKPLRKRDTLPHLAWGAHTFTLGTADDVARAILVQPDYKYVIAGRVDVSGNNEIGLARLNPDGGFDLTFSTDGSVIVPTSGNDAQAHAVTTDSAGRIIVAGRAWHTVQYDILVARFLSNGTIDSSFDSDGIALLNLGASEFGRGVVVQGDDKIIVAGYSDTGGDWDFTISRFDTDGSLDASFGTGGTTITDFGSNNRNDIAYAIAITSDEKFVVAGVHDNGTNDDFAAARYDTDGTLDGTFNTTGTRTDAIAAGDDVAYAIAITTDDKIVLGGKSHNGAQNDFALVRYTTAGGLDNTFDSNGVRTDTVASGGIVRGLSIDTAGTIWVGGRTWNGTNWDVASARYDTDGSINATWGTAGVTSTTIGTGEDTGFSIGQLSQHVLVGGRTDNGSDFDMAIVRHNSDGSVPGSADYDFYFDTDGFRLDQNVENRHAGSQELIPISNGRYVNVGNLDRGFGAMRYLSDGRMDSTFSSDGIAAHKFNGANQGDGQKGLVQTDGKVVVVGNSNTSTWGIVRFNSNGSLDTTFGTAGQFSTNLGSGTQSFGYDGEWDSANRIVAVGSANGLTDFGVIRLTSAGVLDTTFNTTGTLVIDIDTTGGTEYLWDVKLDASDRILAVGPSGGDLTIIRLNTDGTFDSTFASNGIQTLNDGGTEDAYNVEFDADGKIVIAGEKDDDVIVARLLTDGSIDTTFSTDGVATGDSGQPDQATGLAFQADGKIILSGEQNNRHQLARFNTDGTVDTTFATNGFIRFGSARSFSYDVVVEADGRIVTGGMERSGRRQFYIGRHWP